MTRLIGMRPPAASIHHATFLVNAVLAGLIGYASASMFWRALPADNPPPLPVPMEARQGTASPASDTGEQIASMHLLGRAAPLDSGSLPPIPVNAPETRLNLSLRGLLYNPRQEEALAIIGEGGNRPENFYRVGDKLPGGASIHAIRADRVILLRNGRHETLTLPEDRLDISAAAPDAAPVELPDGVVTTEDDDDETADRRPADDARQELMRNPASFTSYVQVEPHSEDGTFVGFRLQPGANPSLMEQSGLEPGDIVVSIDGNRLSSPEAGMQAMRQAVNAESLELEVLRDGNPQTIHIDLSN